MQPDTEKYRKHLTGLGLTKDHEDEIMRFTWLFLQDCVASAFGHHPVQIAQTEKILNAWPDKVKIPRQILMDMISRDNPRLKDMFCTATGTNAQEPKL